MECHVKEKWLVDINDKKAKSFLWDSLGVDALESSSAQLP